MRHVTAKKGQALPTESIGQLMRAPIAGVLSWVFPGLGHLYLGDRARGIVLMAAITLTFWTGIAIGGVRETVDPQHQRLWFTAQLLTGGNTLSALAWHEADRVRQAKAGQHPEPSHWASVDVGSHYTGVAGLMNLLVILDAIGRAEGAPSRRRRPSATGGG